jgi:hypothetical protein
MKYVVQVAIVKDIEVEADDDIQAERAAYIKAGERDRDNIVAYKVLEEGDGGGALESTDNVDNWAWAKKNMISFHADEKEPA